MDHENRVVVLIDMDCFYCQVEEKLSPELKGKPIAVVQYNPWKGGGIIAVNYVARSMGVTRHMRGDEAKEKCPDIQLPSVPCQRGKADITKYRDAGKDVAKVLQKFTTLLERASIDEAYLDITVPVLTRLNTLNVQTVTSDLMPNTFALGYDSIEEFISEVHACGSDSIEFDYDHAKRLLVGALIVSEIRAAVFEETGYRCSAGIAHNKTLAKLVCGMNKPNKQTVLPKHSIDVLYKTLSIKKVRHLGGKFGDAVCDVLKIKTMAELQRFTEKELQVKFDEKNGTWLYNIARGTDSEPVQARFNPKSIGCCKQFRGKMALIDLDGLKKWLKDLGDEIEDRLEKDALENNRTPKQIVVSFSVRVDGSRPDCGSSRSYNLSSGDELCAATFANKALELIVDSAEGCKPKGYKVEVGRIIESKKESYVSFEGVVATGGTLGATSHLVRFYFEHHCPKYDVLILNRLGIDGETNRRLKAPITFLGISVGKFEDNNETKKTKRIKDYFAAGSSKETTRPSNENFIQVKRKTSEDKNYVLNKFLSSAKGLQQINNRKDFAEENMVRTKGIEATLDKQESFFAKYLNGSNNTNKNRIQEPEIKGDESKTEVNSLNIELNRSYTPQCNVIPCEDDSNDTNYSSSTINEEINKSIALFGEDPDDIARVSNMRQLLNNNKENLRNDETHNVDEDFKVENEPSCVTPIVKPKPQHIETIFCSECGKSIPVNKFDEHADYHLALKLREEERKELRKNRERNTVKSLNSKEKDLKKKKPEEISNKIETVTSITNYLTKIENGVPTRTCTECGRKVADAKFSEHQDFHEAQKLSRELNNRPACANVASSAKRKRISTSPAKKPKMQCKSINQFFR